MATLKLKPKRPTASAPREARPPVRGAGSGVRKRPTLAEAQAERAQRDAAWSAPNRGEPTRERPREAPPRGGPRADPRDAPRAGPREGSREAPRGRPDDRPAPREQARGFAIPKPLQPVNTPFGDAHRAPAPRRPAGDGRHEPRDEPRRGPPRSDTRHETRRDPREDPCHDPRQDGPASRARPFPIPKPLNAPPGDNAPRALPPASRRPFDQAPPAARGPSPRGPASRKPFDHAPEPRSGRAPSPRQDDDDDDEDDRPENAPGSLRLSKQMSALGLASRREADEWIAKGWVRVDGNVVSELGSRVMPEQRITIDARAKYQQAQKVTVIVNKPIGYVSGQAEDGYEPAVVLVKPENQWADDQSGTRFLREHLRSLVPAGRLDIDSIGLLVLTQDGRIAKQLIGEDSDVEKEYLVRVAGADEHRNAASQLAPDDLQRLRHGLELDGEALLPATVEWINDDQLRFVLKEGKKRQIRRMCEAVGLHVLGLKRVRIGRVMLGDLPVGQWRYLRGDEVFG